jgi:hypothetical protein
MSLDLPIKVSPRFIEAVTELTINMPGLARCEEQDGSLVLTEWTFEIGLPSDDEIAAALAAIDWVKIRAKRQPLLLASDTIAVRCMKAGQPFPADWRAYTTALRDITKQADPLQVEWPTPPAIPSGV